MSPKNPILDNSIARASAIVDSNGAIGVPTGMREHAPDPGRTAHDLVIETHGLGKRYGDHIVAVDDLDLTVYRGEVYGFLGPNGAGKTTTLRMLLGLSRPTEGRAIVAGAAPGTSDGLARIGAMIEAPTFYPFLSGRDNLRILAMHAGVPSSRIDAVLGQVELGSRSGDRFSTYSLGMKQRLGVAAALLKDPELLILDEPTNGLDPAGMAEMRSLIRELGRGQRTVLLSSHLMNEVEQVCDRVGVIRAGRLVAEGTVDDLRGRTREWLQVRAEPLEDARHLLEGDRRIDTVEVVEGALRVEMDECDVPAINRSLVNANIAVSDLHWERASLEEVFFELTQDETKGEPA